MDFSQLCLYAEQLGNTKRKDLKSGAIEKIWTLYRDNKISWGERCELERLLKVEYVPGSDKRVRDGMCYNNRGLGGSPSPSGEEK